MKWTFGSDRTYREVYSRQIDPMRERFHLSRSRLVYILLTGSLFLLVSAVAWYLEQPFGVWFSVTFGAILTLWQVIFYGYARPGDERVLEAENFYSRRQLILVGTFWLILIALVSWRLWVAAPGHQP